MKYQELGYSLPNISAEKAAQDAIAILDELASIDGAFLFYCIQPSNILALAGLRAQSPYNEFHPDFGPEKQHMLEEILHKQDFEIMLENDTYSGDTRYIFLLNNVKAFHDLPIQYEIPGLKWVTPHKLDDFTDFFLWSEHIQGSLVRLMEANTLPKDWLLDWWAPHNIRFGMLLGYPGQAISSFCWNESGHIQDEHLEHQLGLLAPFRGKYGGTDIDFDYPSSLKGDATLVAHEKLWADVLNAVYKTFPEERLLANAEFKKEYEGFKRYDEGV